MDILNDICLKMATEINNKKFELVNERLQIAGFGAIDFELEKTKKFKKIAIEKENGSNAENGFITMGAKMDF